MRIVFTKHALIRLKERKIKKLQILDVLKNPDSKRIYENNKVEYYKNISKYLSLKVITIKDKNSIIVITCYYLKRTRLKKN